jgi:hypothetical protein
MWAISGINSRHRAMWKEESSIPVINWTKQKDWLAVINPPPLNPELLAIIS